MIFVLNQILHCNFECLIHVLLCGLQIQMCTNLGSMVYGVISLNGPKVEIDCKEEIFENISLNI